MNIIEKLKMSAIDTEQSNENAREMKLTFMQFYKLSEMTEIAAPEHFGFSNDADNAKRYIDFNDENLMLMGDLSSDVRLLYSPDDKRIIALDDKRKRVVLYMNYVLWKNNNLTVAQNIAVWREFTSTATRNIPKSMFFDFLADKYDAVMSDDLETPRMIERWKSWIQDAIHNNMHLYSFSDGKIKKETDWEQMYKDVWGTGKKDIYGLISKHSNLDGKSFKLVNYS
jgi:hypothetical protein